MLSPEDRSELSSCLPTILRHQSNFAVKTAESSFFIERSRNKRFESEDGPKGPKTRLEAQLMISKPKAHKPYDGLHLARKEG